MDFNEIKNTWQNSFSDSTLLNKKEIEARLKIKAKSNTALDRVRRSYLFELYFGGILSVLFIGWIFIDMSEKYKFLFVLLTILFFGIIYSFTWRNYNKIRKTTIPADQLKKVLIQTITDIERYVNFNKSNFSKYLLLPFSVSYGMLIGLFMNAGNQPILKIISVSDLVVLFVVVLVMSAIFIPFSQFVNKKMYKRHLDELKQLLREFEEIILK